LTIDIYAGFGNPLQQCSHFNSPNLCAASFALKLTKVNDGSPNKVQDAVVFQYWTEANMVESSHNAGLWPNIYAPLRNLGARVADWLSPASDAKSADDSYHISMELPGVAESDIEVVIEGGALTVRGEKKTSREEKGETWFFSERQYGAFSRSFRLPPDASEAEISADLKDGVLSLTIPRKTPEAQAGRKVNITLR